MFFPNQTPDSLTEPQVVKSPSPSVFDPSEGGSRAWSTAAEAAAPRRRQRHAFTLMELLVVLAIIGVVIAIAMPALSKARETARNIQCGSTLKQSALAIGAYLADYKDKLPYIDSALFQPDGSRDFNADPFDADLYPHEWPQTMKGYISDLSIMKCPSEVLGYPENNVKISYRLSSADNLNGKPETVSQLYKPAGGVVYNWDLKYLNGRKYDMLVKDESYVPDGAEGWPLIQDTGPYYLIRDFVNQKNGRWLTPHLGYFNQLMLDLHVELVKADNHHGLTDDKDGD